jgi:hypothetical protein
MATVRLRTQAREAYERGYTDGLTLAQKLPWELVDYFVEVEGAELSLGGEPIRDFVNDAFLDATFWGKGTKTYGRVYQSGVEQALRDVWRSATVQFGIEGNDPEAAELDHGLGADQEGGGD